MLSPSVIELADHNQNRVVEFHQSLNDRLDFPPTEIGKRYLRSKLTVALELECNIGGRKLGMYALVGHDEKAHLWREIPAPRRNGQNQLSVFVGDVHFVKDENGIADRIGGIVRLKAFNEEPHFTISNSLYLSVVSGNTVFIDRFLVKDRELNSSRMVSPVLFCRELPCDVVKAGTQMMDNFPSEHTKAEWDRAILVILDCLQKQLSVVLWKNWVFATLKETCDFGLKIADVLVGPF